MPEIGDRVAIAGNKVGQAQREGTVRAKTGNLIRVEWDSGEESTMLPAPGVLNVVPKGRGAKKRPPGKSAAKKPAPKKPAPKKSGAKKPAAKAGAASRAVVTKQPSATKKGAAVKSAVTKSPAGAKKKAAPARKAAKKR